MGSALIRDPITTAAPTPRVRLGGSDSTGFPRAIRIGDMAYVGLQSSVDTTMPIAAQTAAAFDSLVATLGAAEAEMADLVNLRTYYVYGGDGGRDVTEYWERMTAVRLRYLADPGPAATAVRVGGVPTPNVLIGVDGVAYVGADRQRIMPAHAWDWSIPTPFSQGWRADRQIILGGQISADRQGGAIAVGDAAQQTRNTLEYIRHVLFDAGADWSDVASLRICYSAGSTVAERRKILGTIISVIRELLPAPLPAITAFGVDLLYEGLLLEIDGVAIKSDRRPLRPAGVADWLGFDGFEVGVRCGPNILIGGLSAPGAASLAAQVEATLERLTRTLRSADADVDSLVKLTAFYVPDGHQDQGGDATLIAETLAAHCGDLRPVLSTIQTAALPHPGQRFQLDAVAIL